MGGLLTPSVQQWELAIGHLSQEINGNEKERKRNQARPCIGFHNFYPYQYDPGTKSYIKE